MRHSRLRIELNDDGYIAVHSSAIDEINRFRQEIVAEIHYDVGIDKAALVLLVQDQAELQDAELAEIVNWVWHKTHSGGLTSADIASLSDLQLRQHADSITIWPGEDECGFTFSIEGHRFLMPVVYEMQRRLEKPVDFHHVLAAVVSNWQLPITITYDITRGDEFLDVVERSLRKVGTLDLKVMFVDSADG